MSATESALPEDRTLLIVEDDRPFRERLARAMQTRGFDVRIEQVGWSLGASWFYTARTVLLPNIAPSVFAAWIFAFIGSFDEVIVTSFIAGTYETIPKKMFNELILEVNPTITAVATLLMLFTILALGLTAWLLRRAGRLKETLL